MKKPLQYQGSVAPSDYAREDGAFYDEQDWLEIVRPIMSYKYAESAVKVYPESKRHTETVKVIEARLEASLVRQQTHEPAE